MTAAIPNLVEVTDNDYLRGWKDAERVAACDLSEMKEAMRKRDELWKARVEILLATLDGRISADEWRMNEMRRWAE